MQPLNISFLAKILAASIMSVSLANSPLTLAAPANETRSPEMNASESVETNLEQSQESLQEAGQNAQENIESTGDVVAQATEQSVEAAQQQIRTTAETAQEQLEVTTQQAQEEIARSAAEIEERNNWGWLGLLGLFGLFGLARRGKTREPGLPEHRQDPITYSSKS